MWFYCCLWFVICANSQSYQILHLDRMPLSLRFFICFLTPSKEIPNSSAILGYHRVWYNHINDTLSRSTNRFIEILFYRSAAGGIILFCSWEFLLLNFLRLQRYFSRVLFTLLATSSTGILPFSPPIQIIECSENCFRLILVLCPAASGSFSVSSLIFTQTRTTFLSI